MTFLDDLAALVGDPKIRRLAWRHAQDPELAEDALQQAFYTVAQKRDPEAIRNLRAYFCKTLIHTINRSLPQESAIGADLEEIAAFSERRRAHLPPDREASAGFESEVLGLLRAQAALARLLEDRHRLTFSVPSRSGEPARYRESIVEAAEQILRMLSEGSVASEDWTAVIKPGYPEWYDQHDMPPETLSRRLWRAREDTRTLLQALVQREDAPRRSSGRGSVRIPQAPHRLAEPPDERARTADDTAITTLFLKAEQTLLPDEDPYDLERGLQLFTAWLDNQSSDPAGEHPR